MSFSPAVLRTCPAAVSPPSSPSLRRRVSATLHKGSVLDVVIADGEDIADDDFEALVAALKTQGITGVARVKVVGLVEPE